MPEISRFLGIVIAMFYSDHAPPHFHARYGAHEVIVCIDDGAVEGYFPRRALGLLLEWYAFTAKSCATTGSGLALAGRSRRSSPWSDEMAMTPRLEAAEYVADYRIRVRFADGREGEIDLAEELWGEVFEPLRDVSVFRRFRLDRELSTIAWETGADLAPEYIYQKAVLRG